MGVVNTKFTSSIVPEDILTLVDLKEHLRVDFDDEDTTITALRLAAINKIQNLCGRMLDRVTVEFYTESFYGITLPWSPIISVESVKYKTDATTYATLAEANWWTSLNTEVPRVEFTNMPSLYSYAADRVKISATIGWDASAGETPEALVTAVKLLVTDWYELRGDTLVGTIARKVPNGIENLISEYRNLG
jgi:uncharacterized phiE125 gp8 family phage protein